MRYKHVVEYDQNGNKIIITRQFESGQSHLYTELPLTQVSPAERTFEGVGRMLGEALILDTPGLRDMLT